jgi:hypothetical protein
VAKSINLLKITCGGVFGSLALEISLKDSECILRLCLQLVSVWDAAENWAKLEFNEFLFEFSRNAGYLLLQ